MANATDILRERVWESGGADVMFRVTGSTGGTVTRSDVTSTTRRVFDLATGLQASTTALASTDVFYDTVQTDARWTAGGGSTLGYNFRDALSSTVFADGDRTYRIEYEVTPAAGSVYWMAAELYSQDVRSN